ncbi:hypothetical protein [Flavobacterium endophyticum]|nr:hypothetical protein [Flavobacterium endophyticum]
MLQSRGMDSGEGLFGGIHGVVAGAYGGALSGDLEGSAGKAFQGI